MHFITYVDKLKHCIDNLYSWILDHCRSIKYPENIARSGYHIIYISTNTTNYTP